SGVVFRTVTALDEAFHGASTECCFHEIVFENQKFTLALFCKSAYISTQPEPARGTIRGRHVAWRGLRWTLRRQVGLPAGRNVRSVRRNRVVLAPRPWRYAAGKARQLRGQERPFPGEITYKP